MMTIKKDTSTNIVIKTKKENVIYPMQKLDHKVFKTTSFIS